MDAYASGNKRRGDHYAKLLMTSRIVIPPSDEELGERCLKIFTGKEYKYYQEFKRFLTNEEFVVEQSRSEKANEERKLEAERKARQAELEEATRAAEMRKAERERAVWERLGEACETLYRRNADTTISNELCFNYFLTTGLPE